MKKHRALIILFTAAVSIVLMGGVAFVHYFSAVAGNLNPSAPPGPTAASGDGARP